MGHAPENTLASFELAVAMGVDMLECDVHLSRDGVPVVIHDHTLDRTTNGRGLVCEHAIEDLTRLDAGSWHGPGFSSQRLLTLEHLLVWCRDRVPLSIEIKNGPIFYDGIVERVVDLIRKHEMVDRSFLISFDHHAIRQAKEVEPAIAGGVLFHARLVDAAAVARAARADAILPHCSMATSDVVAQAHAADLMVSVWTVDDETSLRHVVAAGVDAVATNYPDRILDALG